MGQILEFPRGAHKPLRQPTEGTAVQPLIIELTGELARAIRIDAGLHLKDPHEFVVSWLRSGFPEHAA